MITEVIIPEKTEKLFAMVPARNSSLVMFQVEEITLVGDKIVSRKPVTERDTKGMTISKLIDRLEREIR